MRLHPNVRALRPLVEVSTTRVSAPRRHRVHALNRENSGDHQGGKAGARDTSDVSGHASAPGQASLASSSGKASAGLKSVLVVDDEEALCRIASFWLKSLGYSVRVAHSGSEALNILRNERFDILFTDIIMPGGMNGVALAEEAVCLYPDITVIFTSGFASVVLEKEDLPGPLLSKPYRKADLLGVLSGV